MATALDIISSSLRLVGTLGGGETVPIDIANDSLVVFQQMVDAWNADRLAIFSIISNDFPFVLGQQSYTVGSGGNFNIARPARITGVSSLLLTNPSNPIEVPMDSYTWEQWQTQVPVKNVDSSFPQIYYDDGGFPLRTLNFWPIPSIEQNSVRIYSWEALTEPAALSTVISFPPGYAEAFRFNLAVRLSAEFGAPLSATIQQIAVESLARVKTMNAPEILLRSDLAPYPDGYNYRADMFGIAY